MHTLNKSGEHLQLKVAFILNWKQVLRTSNLLHLWHQNTLLSLRNEQRQGATTVQISIVLGEEQIDDFTAERLLNTKQE
jgi:hypothetical protein